MDFSWSPEQTQFREQVLRFAREQLNRDLRELDKREEFDIEAWRRCAGFGLVGLPVSEEYGGSGADPLTVAGALESLGYGCRDNGLIFAMNAHLWGCEMPVVQFGDDSQKRRFLPRLASGEWIGALAMAEPEAGSDAFSLRTRAERQSGHYLLTGSKTFVTNAPVADLFLVVASLDPAKGWQSLTAFLVEKGSVGLSVRPLEKMGLRTSTMGEVFFDQCRIRVENRIGEEGAGAAVFTAAMEWERSFILAGAVGSMQRLLERCVDYARHRKQFDKPIGKFQAVSNKLVDMKMRLETSRSLLYKVAWLKTIGKSVFAESAMAKLHISESWVQICLDAIQIFGGYGYLSDMELERELRDALGSRLYSGTSEIQKNLIAQLMGL